jgi:hypothetical protein
MILNAMKLKEGHWFKCKDGQVYYITECGCAMEEGNCPECGDRIGGQKHKLLQNNLVSTEMVIYLNFKLN